MSIELFDIEVREVSLCRKGKNPGAKIAFMKQLKEEDNMSEEEIKELQKSVDELKKSNEELAKTVAEKDAEIAKAKTELEEAVTKAEETPEEESDVTKGMDEEAKAAFEALRKANEESEARIAKMEDAALTSEINKALDEVSLVIKEEDRDNALKTAKAMDEDSRKVYFETLKNAQNALESGETFKELGKAENKESDSSEGVVAKAEAMAKALVEKGEATPLTAMSKVWKDNPEMYEEYYSLGAK